MLALPHRLPSVPVGAYSSEHAVRDVRANSCLVQNEKIFTRVPLFRDCEQACILALAERLRPSIAIPGEHIIREGTVGTAIYLISRGRVAVLKNSVSGRAWKKSDPEKESAANAIVPVGSTESKVTPQPTTVATLSDHDFFGETSLLTESVTSASVRALTFCDVRTVRTPNSGPLCCGASSADAWGCSAFRVAAHVPTVGRLQGGGGKVPGLQPASGAARARAHTAPR
jgi:hypothetical protein